MIDDLDFLIRYRFVRPISRSYESVCFALSPDEAKQRSRWSANVSVRFMATLYQACVLSAQGKGPVNPPSHHDFKRPCTHMFPHELQSKIPTMLLMLAGIYEGAVAGEAKHALVESLGAVEYLAQYRLIVCEDKGFRVLLGPRIEYVVPYTHAREFTGFVLPGTILFVDTRSGRYLTLDPLAIWHRNPRSPFGHMYILRRVEGTTGHYIEDGIAGCPSMTSEITATPHSGILKVPPDVLRSLYSPSLRFHDGERIDGLYRINGIIWRGGASDIYVASRLKDKIPVVLKTFESDDGRFDANYWHFVNEERLSMSVKHEGIVKPAKRVIAGYGTIYEQQYIANGSLQDLLNANGVLSPAIAQDIAIKLLDILHACHISLVVHNDIKPDNILFGDDGSLRLIDFGIAQQIKPHQEKLRYGSPPGSRRYMAPEIMQGGFPSIQSDIFSAGVVLAQMLSSTLPGSPEELQHIRGIPYEFSGFLRRCLAGGAHERFDSAREAAAYLRNIWVRPARCIALDIEGTLVDNSYEVHPRPGLGKFITFCMENFKRVFVYTTVGEAESRRVFELLAGHGEIPESFLDRYEYVMWDPETGGPFKDLRRCLVPLESNCIVDDSPLVIPEDQTHRWVRVREFNEVRTPDRGLFLAMEEIRKMFAMP
ncbi:MAG: protein kinase [Deltaproteobacteria bacterium]|nr:protein kinase [Deltaproteobacteria bacterium]